MAARKGRRPIRRARGKEAARPSIEARGLTVHPGRRSGLMHDELAPHGSVGATMADERTVSDTRVYPLDSANAVLSVVIGERQVGGTALRLNGAIVPFPDQQAPVRIPVGTRPSVLDCITLVEDVNPDT